MIHPALHDILVCPIDHRPLTETDAMLVCQHCGLRYPVVDGIPVMLPDAAEGSLTSDPSPREKG
jgi:uncharacterized protein YbaR (Trm112 family)